MVIILNILFLLTVSQNQIFLLHLKHIKKVQIISLKSCFSSTPKWQLLFVIIDNDRNLFSISANSPNAYPWFKILISFK